MSAVNKPVEYHFSSGVFDRSFVQAVYESLRSVETTAPGTGVFRDILANIPNNVHVDLGGDPINGNNGDTLPVASIVDLSTMRAWHVLPA
jgi:hypothetical protein